MRNCGKLLVLYLFLVTTTAGEGNGHISKHRQELWAKKSTSK